MNAITIGGFGRNDQTQRMTSAEIADLVEKRHDNVKRTIETLSEAGVIVRPQIEDEPGTDAMGRPRITKVYVFEGEQGKRDSIVVVAQLCPEFTARLVDRWQELEAALAVPAFAIPQSYSEALRLAADNADRADKAEAALVEAQPKLEALDRLETSEGSVGPRLAAKMLDMPEKKFTAWLQQNRWAFRQNGVGPLQAYVDKRDRGYLEHRPHTFRDQVSGEDRTVPQMMITPKGLKRLAELLAKVRT